nr:FUSC family protein [Bordetella sp. H567]
MLLPVLILGVLFGEYTLGLVATFGSQCVAIIDQPGGPQQHRTNEMLGGCVLATLTVCITGFASNDRLALWIVVIAECFIYSLFTVFGKRGGLIGFAGLLVMALTMHSPLPADQVLLHAVVTFGGALFYLLFSVGFSRLFWLREEQQAMSVALFATADYVASRASFYDEGEDLEDSYRALIQRQSVMTEKHQAARDVVLRALPRGKGWGDSRRVMIWNMFVDMLQLVDTLFATHTDYAALRRALTGNDVLVFMRDALLKMSLDLERIALSVSHGGPVKRRTSIKAELRAIEYEIDQLKQHGLGEREPEILALLVQIQRRLRNASRTVERLADHTLNRPGAKPTSALRIDKSLTRFMTRQEFRLGMITSNLRMDSPNFRYALRVALAAALAMTVSEFWVSETFSAHNYWIMLTIVIIMKPGFALTRQRNGWRLTGTLIGCVMALILLNLTASPEILFVALLVACIMGNSLVQLNYMASAIFNTIFVVLVFHFVSPGTVSMNVIGERALDTLIGCALSLACSYAFPWWEARYLPPLARAAVKANWEYLRAGLLYSGVMREKQARRASPEQAQGPVPEPPATQAEIDADLNWRLARKNVHIAFSNFAEAFYRMMSEPQSRQQYVPELNNLLIQNHVLASQTTAAVPTLSTLSHEPPPSVKDTLKAVTVMLDPARPPVPPLPEQIDIHGELASLAYPLKLMVRAGQMIRQESTALDG